MTINSTTRKAGPFSGTGTQTAFPFAFKVFATSDVLVVQTDASGNESTLVLNTDYTVALSADQNANPGGTVNLTTAAPTGYKVTVSSAVSSTQSSSIPNNGGFYPKVVEDGLDRLTILVQQALEQLGRSVKFAISDTSTGNNMPPAQVRANNMLGFDSAGNMIAVTPVSGTAAALQADLANYTDPAKGAAMVGYAGALLNAILKNSLGKVVSSVAALRAVDKTKFTQAFATGYYGAGDGGGGAYYLDSADTTSADNGGTVIVATDGGRWKLEHSGIVSVAQFGAKGDNATDNTGAFNAMEASGLLEFYVPEGTFKVASINQGGLVKHYVGPGAIQYGSNPQKLNQPQAALRAVMHPMSRIAGSVTSKARSLVFIGDSITAGFPVGYSGGYPAQITQKIANRQNLPVASQIPFCDFDYVSTSGSVSNGTTGPVHKSLILAAGASFSFVADYVDYLSVYYAQSGTTSTIQIYDSATGVVENLNTAAGSNSCVALGAIPLRRAGIGVTFTVKNTGANPVEINGVFCAHHTANQGVLPQVMAYPGYTTADFSQANVLSAIATQTFYGANNPLYVIALGTNDVFSPSGAITPAQYKSNLQTIVSYLLAAYSGGTSVALVVPWMPYGGSASPILAPFNQYREALYEVARQYSCDVIDGSELNLNANSSLLHYDNLHPTQLGYDLIAQWLFERLGLNALELPPIYVPITPGSSVSAQSNWSISVRGRRARFNGYVQMPASISYPFTLGTISSFATVQPLAKKWLSCATNGPQGTALVSVSGGNIVVEAGPSNPQYIFFDGAEFNLDF